MAESAAIMSYGISVTFATLTGELTDIAKDGETNDMADVSHQASPDLYREFLPGLTDGGTVTIQTNFVGAAGVDPRTKDDLGISIPTLDGGSLDMSVKACLANFDSFDAPLGDKLSGEIAFKISGKPTWTVTPPTP